MSNHALLVARIVLPWAAVVSLGCQSPWQSGAPAATGGGWFSWMGVSERTGDPLTRLAGGGAYSPGDAEADANAQGSRKQLYGARTSELDLSRGGAQSPEASVAPGGAVATESTSPTTVPQSLPGAEDDVAARVARALQSRQSSATQAAATGPDPSQAFDGAVSPAGYQSPATGIWAGPSVSSAPRTVVGTAPPDAESNPFFDPFGGPSASSTSSGGSVASTFASPASPTQSGSSALRLLMTPPPSEPSTPTVATPSQSTPTAPTGSLLRLLGDNPLRKDAPAAR